MSSDPLSPDARDFLYNRVHTFEQLAALLFLFRQSSRPCTAKEVAQALAIAPDSAELALSELACCGVVARAVTEYPGETKYHGPGEPFSAIVGELARIDRESKIELINIMNMNALTRIRTGALKAFSDAFVIGRKRDG
jgi:hypothetical protein